MDRDTRNRIQAATQKARSLLEEEFAAQLEGAYDIRPDGTIGDSAAHLAPSDRLLREKLIAAVDHLRSTRRSLAEAVAAYVREAAFTTLNRFVALKMLEARELILESVSHGEQSGGFKEFARLGLADGLVQLDDHGYRIYIQSLFDEIGREVGVLFDRRDLASLLWPRRHVLADLLEVLNDSALRSVWSQDETIGWVYQYFNREDERRQMRAESAAPRNSRELAVRNQFFTPRYVVEFLADNTLGRVWYEMREGQTRLTEQCRYFVKRPEEGTIDIWREKKDPRELKVLDPACGSGHFLLYAFDLLLTIYEEGWEDATAPVSSLTGRTLQEDYPELGQLRRALPGLILEQNLHGIDIDPRCVQIASLALWMRAQRAFTEHGIDRSCRPAVRKVNTVVAEPIGGDTATAKAFASTLQPPALGHLFMRIHAEMTLAGELGSLLKIEKDISNAIDEARREFRAVSDRPTLPGMENEPGQGELDLSGIGDESFFAEAEGLTLQALQRFAESSSGAAGIERRLFAENAAQGVALVELMRDTYDVVLMNPPFGSPSPLMDHLAKDHTGIKHDVATAFVERAKELSDNGAIGMIVTRTPFFLTYLTAWRTEFIASTNSLLFADFGQGILDALVETCAVCTNVSGGYSLFFDLRGTDDKSAALHRFVTGKETGHVADLAAFSLIQRSPFVYWIGNQLRQLFSLGDAIRSGSRSGHIGALTQDDFRFTRLWWEVPGSADGRDWVPYSRGGSYQPYYADLPLRIKWRDSGAELKAFLSAYRQARGFSPHWTAQLNAYDRYFSPGVTWSSRPHRLGSFWVLPRGSVFGNTGPAILDSSEKDLLCDLALLNSAPYLSLLNLLMPRGSEGDGQTLKYELGYVTAVPFPCLTEDERSALVNASKAAISLLMKQSEGNAKSPCFSRLCIGLDKADWTTYVTDAQSRLADAQERLAEYQSIIDLTVIEAYRRTGELEEADCQFLLHETSSRRANCTHVLLAPADCTQMLMQLLAWLVGRCFGRWPREQHLRPAIDDPFAGPHDRAESSDVGVLVDDPGSAKDIVAAMQRMALEDDLDQILDETLAERSAPNDLRGLLRRRFFPFHIQDYSAARRRAPIFWQLAVRSCRYSVWLYAQCIGDDTFFKLLGDYVIPKLRLEERTLTRLTQEVGPSPTASQRKEIEAQRSFVEELATFRDELGRIAPLWRPDLDDGILITCAPLWRLFPQHRAWQLETKKCWTELAKGDYDWAHLAMHLWPDRVVPKCAKDRSLAIAHGLEEVFWEEDAQGKWSPRPVEQSAVERLIAERSSAAVVAAVEELEEAG